MTKSVSTSKNSPSIRIVQRHEIAVQAERLRVEQVQQQRQKELERVKARERPGPSMEL